MSRRPTQTYEVKLGMNEALSTGIKLKQLSVLLSQIQRVVSILERQKTGSLYHPLDSLHSFVIRVMDEVEY